MLDFCKGLHIVSEGEVRLQEFCGSFDLYRSTATSGMLLA
jgi:hypothetical protein